MSSGNPAFEAAQVAAVGMPAGSEATPKGGPGTGVALEERGGKSQYRGMRRGTVDFIRSSLTGLSSGMGRMQRVALISAGVGMALLAANFGLTIFSIEITKDTQVASGALVDKSTGSAVSTLQETRATRLTDLDFGEDMLMQTRISFTYEDGTRARYDVLGVQIAPVGALDESRRVALLRTLEGTFKVVEGDPEPQLLSDDEVPRLADEDVRAELAENATDATTAAGRALLGRNRPPPRSSKGCGHSPAFCRMLPECCPCNCPGGGSLAQEGPFKKFGVKPALAQRQCAAPKRRGLLQYSLAPSYCDHLKAAFDSTTTRDSDRAVATLESKFMPGGREGSSIFLVAKTLAFLFVTARHAGFALPGLCDEHVLCHMAERNQFGHPDGYAKLEMLLRQGELSVSWDTTMQFATQLIQASRGGPGKFPNNGPDFEILQESRLGDHMYARVRLNSGDLMIPVYPRRLYSDAPCIVSDMASQERSPPPQRGEKVPRRQEYDPNRGSAEDLYAPCYGHARHAVDPYMEPADGPLRPKEYIYTCVSGDPEFGLPPARDRDYRDLAAYAAATGTCCPACVPAEPDREAFPECASAQPGSEPRWCVCARV